jgi:hypothetical protein
MSGFAVGWGVGWGVKAMSEWFGWICANKEGEWTGLTTRLWWVLIFEVIDLNLLYCLQ